MPHAKPQRALWRTIVILLVLLAVRSAPARADALLSGAEQSLFPESIRLHSEVRAQVESIELAFDFAALAEGGDFLLTVPMPHMAYAVGVEVDRGQGYQALMIQAEAPRSLTTLSGADRQLLAPWQGEAPLRANLAALDPGPLRVRVRFQRMLRRSETQVSFELSVHPCPLRDASAPAPRLHVQATVHAFRRLELVEAIGGPAPELSDDGRRADFFLEETALSQKVLWALRYREEATGLGFHFLSHRKPGADPMGGPDGYFLVLLDAEDLGEASERPRTISLVLDRSGSMFGEKIARAKEAALVMLASLRGSDAFTIRTFDDAIHSTSPGPTLASQAILHTASDFVSAIEADGGTNLHLAVTAGLGDGEAGSDTRYRSHERFDAMVLLSDGQATSGITDRLQILEDAREHNRWNTRIYTFAIGAGADVALLEALARETRGTNRVLPEWQASEALVASISELFEDIRALYLANVQVDMPAIAANQVLPAKAPDLFAGGQVLLVGRYHTPGQGTLVLRGDDASGSFLQELAIDAPELAEDNDFIKTVWAMEKIASLRAELAQGADAALIADAIRDLALAYQLQTEYTSFSTGDFAAGDSGSMHGCSTAAAGSGLALLPLLLLAMGLRELRRRKAPGRRRGFELLRRTPRGFLR